MRRSKAEVRILYYRDKEEHMRREENCNRNNGRSGGIRRCWVRSQGGHGHVQGGTHEETPLPVILGVDGAAGLLTEAGVGFGMVKVEIMESEIPELVDGGAQFPGNVCPPDRESVVVCWSEGHGIMVK